MYKELLYPSFRMGDLEIIICKKILDNQKLDQCRILIEDIRGHATSMK